MEGWLNRLDAIDIIAMAAGIPTLGLGSAAVYSTNALLERAGVDIDAMMDDDSGGYDPTWATEAQTQAHGWAHPMYDPTAPAYMGGREVGTQTQARWSTASTTDDGREVSAETLYRWALAGNEYAQLALISHAVDALALAGAAPDTADAVINALMESF